MSSPTRFSAKKRNARHMAKPAHAPEPSSEAREVAPVEAPQAPVEKADTTASPVASLQTASEQLSSAFTSFVQRKPAEVSAAQPAEKSATQPAEKPAENMRSKVEPEKRSVRKRLYLPAKAFVWRSVLAIKQIQNQSSVILAR